MAARNAGREDMPPPLAGLLRDMPPPTAATATATASPGGIDVRPARDHQTQRPTRAKPGFRRVEDGRSWDSPVG